MEILFPVADGRIQLDGGDQELRTFTLTRDHPIRGEGQRDFLGESGGVSTFRHLKTHIRMPSHHGTGSR